MQKAKTAWWTSSFAMFASVLFACYCLLLALESHAGFPTASRMHTLWPWLADRPFGEDGFYMLSVAYNLAAVHHLVYTYNMPATGIQPLSTVVFGAVAYVVRLFSPDRWLLVRVLILFGSFLFLLFSWVIGYVAASFVSEERRRLVFLLAFALTLFDFTLFRLFTYGLETGIYLCLLAVCFLSWKVQMSKPKVSWTQMLAFGLVAGVTGLARIDFGICYAVLLLVLWFSRRASAAKILVAGVVALITVSPWFVFVHSVSGHWLPSSGKAESALISSGVAGHRTFMFVLSLIAHTAPWSFAATMNWPTTVAGFASVLILVLIWRAAPVTRSLLAAPGAFRDTFLPWLSVFLLLTLIYFVFFWSSHFYVRYFAPLAVVSIPLLAIALSELRIVQIRTGAVLGSLVALFCIWDVSSLHTGKIFSSQVLSASYVHKWYPNTRVGAFQSGTMGYFDPNVENLDGKLNQGALIAAQEHELPAFIDNEGIEAIVDWPSYINKLPAEFRSREWVTCPEPTYSSDSMCIVRKGSADASRSDVR